MRIKRDILNDLIQWKNNVYRKPLILQGARQVGKSWILKEFGHMMFSNYVYINFKGESGLKVDFANIKDPEHIIEILSVVSGEIIKPQETLIILDEIQGCNNALKVLKFFCEQAPEYALVCAGSLLKVAMRNHDSSFPVGKVDVMTLYPLSFKEFLKNYKPRQEAFLSSVNLQMRIPESIHTQLIDSYKVYIACGGMPEVVSLFLDGSSWVQIEKVIHNILLACPLDFSKYINNSDIPRIHQVWENIQDELDRKDKKFRYALIQKNARARDYGSAIEWLCFSGLVHRVYAVQTPKLPISAYKNTSAFKLYLADVGLLRSKFKLDAEDVIKGDTLFKRYEDILIENSILQSFVRQFGNEQFYWSSGNQAEIEFLLQLNDQIIPVAVKSSLCLRAKSLSEYRKKYQPKLAVCMSLKNMRKEDDLLNLPFYMVDYLKNIIAE